MGKICVAVVGPPRSGTSAVAGLLHQMGVHMGDSLLPANVHNPKGFYEDMDFVELNARLLNGVEDPLVEPRWTQELHDQFSALVRSKASTHELWGVKDPRLCMTLPMLAKALKAYGCELRVVTTLRSIHHSVDSLKKLHGGMSADRAAMIVGKYSYARSMNMEKWMQADPQNLGRQFQVLYDQLVDEPDKVIAYLQTFVGLEPKVTDELRAWIDPQLQHEKSAF